MLVEWRWMAGVTQLRHQRARRFLGDIDERHFRALRGELRDFLGADAATAAGDEHHAVAQAGVVGELLAHAVRSFNCRATASTIASGGASIDTVIGCSSGPGSTSVANWLSSNVVGMKCPLRADMRSAIRSLSPHR